MKIFRFLPLLLCCLPAFAHALAIEPKLAAKHYALYDLSSQQMLVEQRANERIAPASLTKLMTAYVVFGALKQGKISLGQDMMPTSYALRLQNEEPRMFLEVGREVTVEDLIQGLVVQSANDAARVLSEAVANHEIAFADLMNAEAKRLGMNNTHFKNATGVPEEQHFSTAHDLAILAAALISDFPKQYAMYSVREFKYNGINQFNRNRLLWQDPYVDGMQTSHTEGEGFSLIASAKRDERRLVSVLIGTDKENLRSTESQRLLNFGFKDFESAMLYRKDQAISKIRIWKGTEREIKVGFRTDTFISTPIAEHNKLTAQLETKQPLIAPVNAGQRVGTLHLTLNGQKYLDLPVFATETVPLTNVFSRGVDAIRLLFE